MFSEHEDCLEWCCDGCQRFIQFDRLDRAGYFTECVDEIKHRGWMISRGREWGDWKHYCPKCRKGMARRF